MSVLVTVNIPGDTSEFRASLTAKEAEYRTIADRARSHGALHHRFGIGNGFVQVTDEWETEQEFRTFFSDPELQTFIKSVGGHGAPPEITVTEAITSPDQF